MDTGTDQRGGSRLSWGIVDCREVGAVAGRARPRPCWPVMKIDVELAIAMRRDGVDDEGGSRGDISTTRKCLFHTPNRYPIPWPFVLFCHLHTCLNSLDNERQCLHPSLEGRGNVVVMGGICAGFLG